MAKCTIKSETAKGLLPKVLEAIKTGNYLSLVQTLIVEFPKVKEEVKECLESEPVLKTKLYDCDGTIPYTRCMDKCKIIIYRPKYYECTDICKNKYCNKD